MCSDLVVFGEDWGGHPSSTQHLVRHLSLGRAVVWVNSIGLRRPRLSAADLGRVWRKLKAMCGGAHLTNAVAPVAQMGQQPFVLAPRAVPWPGNPLARWLNRRLLGHQVGSVLAAQRMQRPILWISLPTAVDAIGELNEAAVVYYCGDDFSALAGVDHGPVQRLEQELAERADLILVASPMLAARFPPHKTKLLPHGVDWTLFSRPTSRASDLPVGPVAGFYGSLAEWLDQALLVELARQLPHWQFVLIGTASVDVSRLEACDNVHLLGPRSHKQLPSYVQHWDVSLLPFCDNTQIRACNPLKLREYLAAGTPIVATDFPALVEYGDLLTVATDTDDFVQAMQAALAEGRNRAAQRSERVRVESWSTRAAQVDVWLEQLP